MSYLRKTSPASISVFSRISLSVSCLALLSFCPSHVSAQSDVVEINSELLPSSAAASRGALPAASAPVMAGSPMLTAIEPPPDAGSAFLTAPDEARHPIAAPQPDQMVSPAPVAMPVAEPQPQPAVVAKADPVEAEPLENVDDDVAGDIVKAEAETNPAVPVQDVAAMPEPEEVLPPVTAAWQSGFIKALSGGDGTINMDLVASDAPEVNLQEIINLDEAVAFALENNYELKASLQDVKSKDWDKKGAYAQYLPYFEMNAAVGRERSRPASINDSNGDRVLDDTHLRRDRTLTIRQPILDLGVISDIISGHDKLDLADYQRMDTQDTVASDTVSSYLSLMQSRMSIQLADQYKAYLDDLSVRMKARVEGGGAPRADLDRIISRATLAESARVEAVGEYETSMAEFRRLTGVTPLKIRIPDLLAPPVPPTIDDALSAANYKNPKYLASLKKIEIAEADRKKSYSGLLPKVYGLYSDSYAYNAGAAAHGNPVDGVYPTQRTDSVMLVAQWSINGGTSVTSGMSAAAKEQQMKMLSQDVRERLQQAIRSGYTAVGASNQRLEVLQKSVRANERVVKGFEVQYENGTRPLFDLLDAYEQLYNSRLNLMRVIFANAEASYQVRQDMGELVPSILDMRKQ